MTLEKMQKEKKKDPEKKEDCTDYKLTDREKIYGDSCCYVVSKKKIMKRNQKVVKFIIKNILLKNILMNILKK